MSLAPQNLLPQLAPWVANLGKTWPGAELQPYFAHLEVLHILSLVVLGGASLLLNLRLLGVDLSEQSPSEVRRNVGPYLHMAVIGIIVTGLLMGDSNALRLYTSEAFTAKMIGLAAGLVLVYGVTWPLASGRSTGVGVRIAAVLGLALWTVSIGVFAVGRLINPGLWHLITAAALMVFIVIHGRARRVYLVGLLALLVAQIFATAVIIGPGHYAKLDPTNKAFAWAFAGWIGLAAGSTIFRGTPQDDGGRFQRGMAYAGMLVWITVAAAGRWIAFA